MISCKDARHLFDRYLDGELAPSLHTELHAHRLNCTECQNELAMLEAIGDVVALDRCEPALGASFTDRVLLARRAQLRPVRRPWSRTALLIGSPMAAAASIAFAIFLIAPSAKVTPTVILGARVNNDVVAEAVKQPQPDLAAMPDVPVGLLENYVFAPLVQKSQATLAETRRGAESLAHMVLQGLADDANQFADQRRATHGNSENPVNCSPAEPAQLESGPEINCAVEPL